MRRTLAATAFLLLAGAGCADGHVDTSGPETTSPADVDTGPQPTILNPEDVPTAYLARLDQVSFAFVVPEGWDGPQVVCTKVKEGWNDCVPVRMLAERITDIGAYYGPDRVVEVWLLNVHADLRGPMELLGTIDLASFSDLLRRGETEGGVILRVELGGTLAKGGVPRVQGPTLEVTDGGTWDEISGSYERQIDIFGYILGTEPQPTTSLP